MIRFRSHFQFVFMERRAVSWIRGLKTKTNLYGTTIEVVSKNHRLPKVGIIAWHPQNIYIYIIYKVAWYRLELLDIFSLIMRITLKVNVHFVNLKGIRKTQHTKLKSYALILQDLTSQLTSLCMALYRSQNPLPFWKLRAAEATKLLIFVRPALIPATPEIIGHLWMVNLWTWHDLNSCWWLKFYH